MKLLTAHLFGDISFPSCSNYVIKENSADNVNKYGNEASTIVKRNLYVEDMLKSFPDVKTARDMVNKVRALHLAGGFNLRRFTTNDVDLLYSELFQMTSERIE